MPAEAASVKDAFNRLHQHAKASLRIHFAKTTVSEPGVKLSTEESSAPPMLSISSSVLKSDKATKYIAISLDLDAPFPSLPILGPIVHGIQTDLEASAQSDGDGFVRLETTVKPLIPYLGPAPPKISSPHRYLFLLWEQPDGLAPEKIRTVLGLPQEVGVMGRMRWDEEAFEKKVGLGSVLAGNYFTSG